MVDMAVSLKATVSNVTGRSNRSIPFASSCQLESAKEYGSDHAGVGPHPHRGFSPVTFIFKGGVHHRDSRGNDSVIYAGGAQWMNAGMGIITANDRRTIFMRLADARRLYSFGSILPQLIKWISLRISLLPEVKHPLLFPSYMQVS
jgi:hypothetical protein